MEASYITVSYFGELDWNEMRSKRSNMISLWNAHGYHTYLFGIKPAEVQVVRVLTQMAFGFFRPLDPRVTPSGLNKTSTSYVCLRSSNSEHCLVSGGRYGILTGFSRRCRECGLSLSSKTNIGITTYVLFAIRARWRPENGEMRRTKVIDHCS